MQYLGQDRIRTRFSLCVVHHMHRQSGISIIKGVAHLTDYIVRPGDTLSSIARLFGVPFPLLLSANPEIVDPESLVEGQTIHFPPGYPVRQMIEVNGYAFPNIDAQVLLNTLQYLTYLSIFNYQIRPDGMLVGIDDGPLIQMARRAFVAPLLVISNINDGGSFSSDLVHAILSDELLQITLINNVIRILKSKNYFGLNINFENIYPSDREAYARFLQAVTANLHPLGYIIVSSGALRLNEDRQGLLFGAEQYPVLYSREVNRVSIIVTYEFGYTYGPPMAVVPLNQLRRALDNLVSIIPSKNILMGMTNYGFDWALPYNESTPAYMLSFAQAKELALRTGATIQFDQEAQSPFFYYQDDMGVLHLVWFDDEVSIRARLELVRLYNLGGVSFWTINQFSPESYLALIELYDVRKMLSA